ncbi:MAG: hypothetical protein ACXIUD_16190 [Mongoliitalea sp.]
MQAPHIDNLIEYSKRHAAVTSLRLITTLQSLFQLMERVQVQGDDLYRAIWITAERGGIEDFGVYEEYLEVGEVSNEEEFQDLWEMYYPDEFKWYKFSVANYQYGYYFYLDSELIFQFDKNQVSKDHADEYQFELCNWLSSEVLRVIDELSANEAAFNQYLEVNLPHKKRLGRIQRRDLWSIFPQEKIFFENHVSPEMVAVLQILKSEDYQSQLKYLPHICALDFFKVCELGYEANEYFTTSKNSLSPKEKYIAKADGRDCGLTKIDEISSEEFSNWYDHESQCGGHPWEVCRGGNATHISLYVKRQENGWYFILSGCSSERVVETVKFAHALYTHQVPFILHNADEIYKMILGIDFIGIVPEHVFPKYCHGLFSDGNRYIDFMNLGHEESDSIIKKAYWFPLEKVEMCRSEL